MNKQKGKICSVCGVAYAEQDSDMCNRCSVDEKRMEGKINWMTEENLMCSICGGLHPSGHRDKELKYKLEVIREFVLSRRDDIEQDMENFGMLKTVLSYFLEGAEG